MASDVQQSWRAYFGDPRLGALILAALENNRDLRIAAARVQEARAQFGVARADRLPGVNLGASASFSKTPGDLSATGVPLTGQQYTVGLSTISYELDFWGRLSSLSEAARDNLLATKAAQRVVQIALVADVALAYFGQLQLDEAVALSRTSVSTREQTLVLVGKGRDIGGADESEYQHNLAVLEATRAGLEALEYQRAVAANRLQFLVVKMPTDLPPPRGLTDQSLDVLAPAGLPAQVLVQRPDVMAAEYRLRAAHANVAAARAAFWPSILLTAGTGVASTALSGLFQAGSWSFQPALSLPLFDGGRTTSNSDLADARKEIAVAEYEKTIQTAFREVADLLAAQTAATGQLRAAQSQVSAQSWRLRAARARAEAGLAGAMEVLESQREMLLAEQNVLQARRQQLDTATQLYRALGGGAPFEQIAQASELRRRP